MTIFLPIFDLFDGFQRIPMDFLHIYMRNELNFDQEDCLIDFFGQKFNDKLFIR